MRAADGVLAFFLGEAKHDAAMPALAVDMRFTVAEFVLLHFKRAREFVPNLQKGAIFLLSAINIAGEKTEHIKRDQDQLQDPKDPAFEKETNDQKRKIDPKDCLVELVIAVSPVHKANEFIRKFAFLHENFLSCEISPTV